MDVAVSAARGTAFEPIDALAFPPDTTELQRRQASEEGKLFGSVTSQDLVDFLDKHGVKVERRRVQLPEPIKTLGETSVPVRLHGDVTAQLRVSVVRE